ncbi:MAG: hypothetical protein A2Y58_04175 [Chloroflexi bacterium RBG_13_51_52]|nr:MAG: hypothetical protein A2Y58_04175 [Chloroflexi bacterium RBG_13_51_52]
MRRVLVYLLLITGILTIIVGIGEAITHPERLPVAHIVISSIFALICIVHIVINRKSVMRYIKGK